MTHDALLLQFPDADTARIAADTYRELGYDPCSHGETRLHIHVRGEDLTSALEILQSLGGRIIESEAPAGRDHFNMAYGLDAIPIPAHIVNEDWIADTTADTETNADAPYDHYPVT